MEVILANIVMKKIGLAQPDAWCYTFAYTPNNSYEVERVIDLVPFLLSSFCLSEDSNSKFASHPKRKSHRLCDF